MVSGDRSMKRSKRKPEEWRDIEGYEGYYQISSHGRVKSLERIVERSDGRSRTIKERVMKVVTGHRGYLCIRLRKQGKQKFRGVHRLVAEAFIPNPENKPTVDHKYDEKVNNYYQDLRWGTHQEQIDWARGEQGLMDNSGENNHQAVLTNDQAEEIIRLLQKGNAPRPISKQYDVNERAISRINQGSTWANILPEVPRPISMFYKKKLTTEEVEQIINEIQNTNKTWEGIAKKYNMVMQSVGHINTGKSFKEVLSHIQRPIRSKTNKDRA